VRLFTKASEAGHAPSMVDLGLMFYNGEGVQVDLNKAAMWYKRAADLGDSSGMVNLGYLHQQGKGVEQDDVAAVNLYRRAADAGNAAGIHNLASMYESGRGLGRKDPEQAADLVLPYRRSCAMPASMRAASTATCASQPSPPSTPTSIAAGNPRLIGGLRLTPNPSYGACQRSTRRRTLLAAQGGARPCASMNTAGTMPPRSAA
jgi:TPR repeat protein